MYVRMYTHMFLFLPRLGLVHLPAEVESDHHRETAHAERDAPLCVIVIAERL